MRIHWLLPLLLFVVACTQVPNTQEQPAVPSPSESNYPPPPGTPGCENASATRDLCNPNTNERAQIPEWTTCPNVLDTVNALDAGWLPCAQLESIQFKEMAVGAPLKNTGPADQFEIRSEAGWEDFWNDVLAGSTWTGERPQVDFTKDMLIVVANDVEERNYAPEIIRVAVQPDSIYVELGITKSNRPNWYRVFRVPNLTKPFIYENSAAEN